MKKIISVILLAVMILTLFSCGSKESLNLSADEIKDVVEVEMSVENFGKINLELYHDIAPITVENFVKLTCEGFYDGTVFHRIVSGFMIQGGDDNGDGIGGSDETIKGEFLLNGVQNNISHERGVISMARTGQSYDSASSQFFICHDDATSLDGQYAAFGKVTKGIEVVDAIAAVETDYNSYGNEKSVPKETVKIEYVIVTKTYDRDNENEETAPETKSEEELYADPIKVEMSVKDHGKIVLELYPNLAPITVENFISLAKSGFYDGTEFHRVYEGFMIQGGDDDGDGVSGSEKTIKGEFLLNGVHNPLSHERGVISMARTSQNYDSAYSQFFICHADAKSLDGQYAAFGKVIEGIETVDSIAKVEVELGPTGEKTAPVEDVILEYVKVLDGDTAVDTTATDTTTAEIK